MEVSSDGIMGVLEEKVAITSLTSFTPVASLLADDDPNTNSSQPDHPTISNPLADLGPADPALFDAQPIIDAFGIQSDTISLIEDMNRLTRNGRSTFFFSTEQYVTVLLSNTSTDG